VYSADVEIVLNEFGIPVTVSTRTEGPGFRSAELRLESLQLNADVDPSQFPVLPPDTR